MPSSEGSADHTKEPQCMRLQANTQLSPKGLACAGHGRNNKTRFQTAVFKSHREHTGQHQTKLARIRLGDA
eukprot:3858590-Alexandrium_andersonii.AAC.1